MTGLLTVDRTHVVWHMDAEGYDERFLLYIKALKDPQGAKPKIVFKKDSALLYRGNNIHVKLPDMCQGLCEHIENVSPEHVIIFEFSRYGELVRNYIAEFSFKS